MQQRRWSSRPSWRRRIQRLATHEDRAASMIDLALVAEAGGRSRQGRASPRACLAWSCDPSSRLVTSVSSRESSARIADRTKPTRRATMPSDDADERRRPGRCPAALSTSSPMTEAADDGTDEEPTEPDEVTTAQPRPRPSWSSSSIHPRASSACDGCAEPPGAGEADAEYRAATLPQGAARRADPETGVRCGRHGGGRPWSLVGRRSSAAGGACEN